MSHLGKSGFLSNLRSTVGIGFLVREMPITKVIKEGANLTFGTDATMQHNIKMNEHS